MNFLNKPIFVVGHARGGSTLLGAIINAHSYVGPNFLDDQTFDTEKIKDYNTHLNYSESLEQKNIWFKYFKGENCFTHIGKEIYEENLNLSKSDTDAFIEELTLGFENKRFLSKSPTNSFRINAIKEIFPDSKVVAILRKGEEVVASWGKRGYGFGQKVEWGGIKVKKLSYFQGINIFSEKWEEVIKAIEEGVDKHNILVISYDELIYNTKSTLTKVLDFLDLPYEEYIDDIILEKDEEKWKDNIPYIFQLYLKVKSKEGLGRMKELGLWFK